MSSKEIDWPKIIDEQAKSELNIRQFCEAKQIGIGSFYKYRAALTIQSQAPISPFIQAEIADDEVVTEVSIDRMICHHGQTVLDLPMTTDPLWLATLIGALS